MEHKSGKQSWQCKVKQSASQANRVGRAKSKLVHNKEGQSRVADMRLLILRQNTQGQHGRMRIVSVRCKVGQGVKSVVGCKRRKTGFSINIKG